MLVSTRGRGGKSDFTRGLTLRQRHQLERTWLFVRNPPHHEAEPFRHQRAARRRLAEKGVVRALPELRVCAVRVVDEAV